MRINVLINTKSKFDLSAAIPILLYAHPNGGSPDSLHWYGDEAGDGVS